MNRKSGVNYPWKIKTTSKFIKNMKISVIVPTYKPQSYLWECINSLACQTFPMKDFEVILVLNGCDKPYIDDIEGYLTQCPQLNINFIHIEEKGVSNARNFAIEIAKGDYLTFIDDDDYVSPSYLEELFDKAAPDTITLSYPYAFKDGSPEVQLPYDMTQTFLDLSLMGKQYFVPSRKFFSGPCMKLIPKGFIRDKRFDVKFKNGEDSLFMFLISDKFLYVDYTSKHATYYRRIRQGSAVNTQTWYNKIVNRIALMYNYTKIYLGNPRKYSFVFYFTRMLASIHALIR